MVGRTSTAYILILVLSIAGLTILATSDFNYGCSVADSDYACDPNYFPAAKPQAYVITVKSKTAPGGALLGVRITVDTTYYSTPFSLMLQGGSHTFTAPTAALVGGAGYQFVRWEDEYGSTVSTQASFIYDVESNKDLHAVYVSPNPPPYPPPFRPNPVPETPWPILLMAAALALAVVALRRRNHSSEACSLRRAET